MSGVLPFVINVASSQEDPQQKIQVLTRIGTCDTSVPVWSVVQIDEPPVDYWAPIDRVQPSKLDAPIWMNGSVLGRAPCKKGGTLNEQSIWLNASIPSEEQRLIASSIERKQSPEAVNQ